MEKKNQEKKYLGFINLKPTTRREKYKNNKKNFQVLNHYLYCLGLVRKITIK